MRKLHSVRLAQMISFRYEDHFIESRPFISTAAPQHLESDMWQMFLAVAQAGLDCRCLVQSAEVGENVSENSGAGGGHRRNERMRSAEPSRSAQAISYSGGFHPGPPQQLVGGQVSVCTRQWRFCNWHRARREWVSALVFALDVSHQSINTSPQERLLENLIVVQWWDFIGHNFLISSVWFLFFLGILQLNPFFRRCGVFIVDLLDQLSRFAFAHYCNVSWHDLVPSPTVLW